MSIRKSNILILVFLTVAVLFVNVGNCEENEDKAVDNGESRTFGHHFLKRMSFAVLPIMYKMGMMTTLLITLTIMSTKGLAIGVLLLVLGISQIIARSFPPLAPLAPLAAPIAAPYAAPYAAPFPPPAYPLVYSHPKPDWPAVLPVVQKAHAVVHSAPTYAQTYATGWHAKSGYSPYAREDTEENPEYVNKN